MRRRSSCVWPASLLLVAALLLSSVPATAVAPAGKSFAMVLVLPNFETGELEVERACGRFGAALVCTEEGDCGPWEFMQRMGARNEWRAHLQLEDDDELIGCTIFGLTERRGPRSAIAGTMLLTLGDVKMNASFAGIQMRPALCRAWAASDD